jgi:hypothetical protein
VSLPKSFLAVNLSDAFTFQEKQTPEDGLEMKPLKRAGMGISDDRAEGSGTSGSANPSLERGIDKVSPGAGGEGETGADDESS